MFFLNCRLGVQLQWKLPEVRSHIFFLLYVFPELSFQEQDSAPELDSWPGSPSVMFSESE